MSADRARWQRFALDYEIWLNFLLLGRWFGPSDRVTSRQRLRQHLTTRHQAPTTQIEVHSRLLDLFVVRHQHIDLVIRPLTVKHLADLPQYALRERNHLGRRLVLVSTDLLCRLALFGLLFSLGEQFHRVERLSSEPSRRVANIRGSCVLMHRRRGHMRHELARERRSARTGAVCGRCKRHRAQRDTDAHHGALVA